MLNISIAAALSLLLYFYSFKDRNTEEKIYGQGFFSFLFAGLFFHRYAGGNYEEAFLLSLACFLFLFFLLFYYRDYSGNSEVYYLASALFFLANFLLYYGLKKSPHLFIKIIEGDFLSYSLYPLAALLIILQLRKDKQAYFLILSLACLALANQLGPLALLAFFLLSFLYIRQLLYLPLLEKNMILEEKVKRREAELPEHLREKFQIMEHNKAKLMDMAFTDKMTGIYNKEKIIALIKDMIKDQRVQVFSLVMFDIDNFKRINDNLGHLVGDEAIINLAKTGERTIRKQDSIGRYGGDEFIILLPSLNAIDAKIIAERFRKRIEETSQPHFTISIGVASYPEDGKSFKELLESADQALYKSKERGKNMVSHLTLY